MENPTLKFKESGYVKELTIGMPVYNDFDGVYFTLQALRMYQDCDKVEFLIIDNYGCDKTKSFVEKWVHGRYIRNTEKTGTAYAKNIIFQEAKGNAVLCMDCHILLMPEAIRRLKKYYAQHPHTMDLLQGPLVYDDLKKTYTHFDPRWKGDMYGVWAYDKRIEDNQPFEIPMQGMGVFSCKRDAWLGFNPDFKGFGGEEGYIHEKFRQAGRKCLCLPWLKWVHKFERPNGIPYPLSIEDKIRNYVIGWYELGLDMSEIIDHFSDRISLRKMLELVTEATGRPMSIVLEEDEDEKELLANESTIS